MFMMAKDMTSIRLQELFTLDENNKGTRGRSLKLAKLRCSRDCWKHFFKQGNQQMVYGLDQQMVEATNLNVFKNRLVVIRNTRMGFFMD